ncbi:hypothetical protein CYMTET_55555 [Cymbomonas tetramitiformis]|uniref:CCT domain-containing protein n=1 Tax=Cymbomonas tetramitiformis TaxID=36881 RepID=A0AAE0BD37_9CHLO|nr:hypothetical protein CYMTET_55555 [Cymbomonas tetramitiformis]
MEPLGQLEKILRAQDRENTARERLVLAGLTTLVTPTADGIVDVQFQIRQDQLPVETSGTSLNGSQDGPRAASQSSASNSFEVPSDVLYVGTSQPLCREARLLRYKEKRKNRKFEKTIRYAARAAYAESRPRVKGRFAKRDNESDDSPVEPPYGGESLLGVDNHTQSSRLQPTGLLQPMTSQLSSHQASQAIPSSHGNNIFGSMVNSHPLVQTPGFPFPVDSELGTLGPELNTQLQSLLHEASLCTPSPPQQ